MPTTFLTTTSNALDGYRVTQTFGVVRGITVRSRSLIGTFGACVANAQALGANALLAVRYDATEIMRGVSEVLCYGTAVRVVAVRRGGDEEEPS